MVVSHVKASMTNRASTSRAIGKAVVNAPYLQRCCCCCCSAVAKHGLKNAREWESKKRLQADSFSESSDDDDDDDEDDDENPDCGELSQSFEHVSSTRPRMAFSL